MPMNPKTTTKIRHIDKTIRENQRKSLSVLTFNVSISTPNANANRDIQSKTPNIHTIIILFTTNYT